MGYFELTSEDICRKLHLFVMNALLDIIETLSNDCKAYISE